MKNHFHFFVQFNEMKDIQGTMKNPDRYLSQQLSNLFNAYARIFNKVTQRHGGLFERPFKRKLIDNETYLKQLIVYIHTNPVHHHQVEVPNKYRWSSYNEIVQENSNLVDFNMAIKYFEDLENFIFVHQQKSEVLIIENW